MSTSFIAGFWLIGVLCIVCLTASIAVLIKTQETHSRCMDILMVAYDWLEQIRHEDRKEDRA